MKRSDVVLMVYPFTDASGVKVRPAIIVSLDAYNQGDDLVFVPVTSTNDPSDRYTYEINRSHPAFRGSGLKQESFVKWTKPTAFSRTLFKRRLGRIDEKTMSELRALITSVF